MHKFDALTGKYITAQNGILAHEALVDMDGIFQEDATCYGPLEVIIAMPILPPHKLSAEVEGLDWAFFVSCARCGWGGEYDGTKKVLLTPEEIEGLAVSEEIEGLDVSKFNMPYLLKTVFGI